MGSDEGFFIRYVLKQSSDVGDPYRGLKRLREIETQVGDDAPLRCLKATGGGSPGWFSSRSKGQTGL
jgi:hypothetical protein